MALSFVGSDGNFRLGHAERVSGLYFPLCAEGGLRSCVTPRLGGGYDVSIQEMEAQRDACLQAGQYDYAEQWQSAISRRVKIENDEAATLAGENDDTLAPGEYTPEQWDATLNAVQVSPSNYYQIATGDPDKPLTLSKPAFMRWIVWNKLGLTSEDQKRARWSQVSKGPTRGLRAVVSAMERPLAMGDSGGLWWQGVDEEGKPEGEVYPMANYTGEGNFTVNDKGEIVANAQNIHGVLYVRNNPSDETYTQISPEQAAHNMNLVVRYMDEWADAHPEATDYEMNREAVRVLGRAFIGSPINGLTSQLSREVDLMGTTQRMSELAAQRDALLRYLDANMNDEQLSKAVKSGNAQKKDEQ